MKENGKINTPKIGRRCSALLLCLILVSTMFFTVSCNDDKDFEYLTANLDDYIEFKSDYKNFDIEVDIAKPREVDIDVAILSILANSKGNILNNGGLVTSPITIGAGDVVHIWYRGYLIGNDGEEIVVSGMTNFDDDTPFQLGIGSNAFIPGFEVGLCGINTGDYNKFEKITEGKVNESQVAYVTYTVIKGEDSSTKKTETYVRMDLSDDLDATFGAGFKSRVLMAEVGKKFDFAVEKDGVMNNYYDVTVNFVTECEDNPIKVETYFPYDYSVSTLQNETAYFEVYVEGVVNYENKEFTDEFITSEIEAGNLTVTLDELNEYEGDTLVEKYRAYAAKILDDVYNDEYDEMFRTAVWSYLKSIVDVKKYPSVKVNRVYEEYLEDVNGQYAASGGVVTNSYTGESNTYKDIDSYARAYLGLSSSADWKAHLTGLAESIVKERLILYYIMRNENLTPTGDAFDKALEATHKEYIDEYVDRYLNYENKTKDDYTEEEYEEFVEERKKELFKYYDDTFFEETTYYNVVLDAISEWEGINVSTYDDGRRAYPLDQ